MLVLKKKEEISRYIGSLKKDETIGFVPTMGFLHEGHLSLVELAKKENSKTIVSIFVNPKQFGPKEDFKTYPREIERDKKLLKRRGIDVLFLPEEKDFYRESSTIIDISSPLSKKYCGMSRPSQFDGVMRVICKFFHIIQPNKAYFGKKDYQQVFLIKKMVEELDFNVDVRVAEIVRDKKGLALSSRNSYLSEEEKETAANVFSFLSEIKKRARTKTLSYREVKSVAVGCIGKKKGFRVDYLSIVNKNSLKELKETQKDAILLVAVLLGKTRLIDNIEL